MTISVSKVLERELGKRLKADVRLIELFGGTPPVLTTPSEKDQLPYIIFNENRLDAWDDDTSTGGDHTVVIEVWSDTESESSVKEILDAIKQCVNRCEKFISISPYHLVTIDFQFQDLIRETDGQAYRGVAQFRALTGGL